MKKIKSFYRYQFTDKRGRLGILRPAAMMPCGGIRIELVSLAEGVVGRDAPAGRDRARGGDDLRPGTIKRDQRIVMPRSRDPSSAEFNALKRELGMLVMEERERHSRAEMQLAAAD